MRYLANVRSPAGGVARVLLHATDHGVYLFPCATLEDGSAIGDEWYASLDDAQQQCRERWHILPEDWTELPDPPPGCQQDWIAPVRIARTPDGLPIWGRLERLEQGRWVPITPPNPDH
jgi:biofilm protein TabA